MENRKDARAAVLDNRLSLICSLVPKGSILADIGTDHGYLSVALLREDICPKVYACDVNEMPLASAKKNLADLPADRWETVLTDGTKGLPLAVNCFVVAGMGAELILHILDEGKPFWREDVIWILQPMTKQEQLRGGLAERGFAVETEKATFDSKKGYTVMVCRYTGKPYTLLAKEAWFGLHLAQTNEQPSKKYLLLRADRLAQIAAGKCQASSLDEDDPVLVLWKESELLRQTWEETE